MISPASHHPAVSSSMVPIMPSSAAVVVSVGGGRGHGVMLVVHRHAVVHVVRVVHVVHVVRVVHGCKKQVQLTLVPMILWVRCKQEIEC